MTSHYRHRRTSNPAVAFAQLEPGELSVNTANRQIAIGDADAASIGSPLALLAVRIFDARSRYAAGDFATYGGAFYRAKADINFPAAFNLADWEKYSDDTTTRNYIDGSSTGKVARAGDTMTGPLVLAADPAQDLEAATRRYVDAAIDGVTTEYQAADDAIANTYLPLTGGALVGPLVLAADPTANLGAATKQYVDAKGTGLAEAPTDGNAYARLNGAWSNITATFAVMVPKTRVIGTTGLATGGGPLDGDLSIAVTAATQAEAEAGTDATKAMTPQRTAQSIAALQLIKAIASQTEAETGTNNTKGMTPLRVKQAITKQVGDVAAVWDTGDVKFTINTVASLGWLLMNDGTIGDDLSGATHANPDCEALYKLLWANINQTYAPVLGGRGASADADWTAHKPIALLKVLGRALAAAGAGAGLTPHVLGQTDGVETVTLTAAQIPAHEHQLKMQDTGKPPGGATPSTDPAAIQSFLLENSGGAMFSSTAPNVNSTNGLVTSIGGGAAHTNVQPTTFLNVMIRL